MPRPSPEGLGGEVQGSVVAVGGGSFCPVPPALSQPEEDWCSASTPKSHTSVCQVITMERPRCKVAVVTPPPTPSY